TNRDIGFVREGMPVEIKIDTFPNLEFGSIKGKLINIGSDALPPTQERPFYAFPAKIEMDTQVFDIGGRKIPLQAGMSVSTSILVRKRTVMTIFLSQFSSKTESLKYVR
ncbi:MAG: HlyD family efflux transporter periplasmic adaptor subunit, partial [Pseudanabaena sp. RU_4_16]|nr:HlyD family efflux transporter periplasmic adaptor subunit [Pseudanabaena sp. RU_4_16]